MTIRVKHVARSTIRVQQNGVGPAGADAWRAVFAIVNDGERRVRKVVDWVGGSGTEPDVGQYEGATGLVPLIADAVDIRGGAGGIASDIVFTPTGGIAATNVQAALAELDTEKAAAAYTPSGNISATTVHAAIAELDTEKADAGAMATALAAKLDDSQASVFGLTLLDDADAPTARSTLGLNETVLGKAYASYATWSSYTTTIPADDTIPQNTEGSEVLTVSITPKSATSKLRVRVSIPQFTASAILHVAFALFRDSGANAVAVATQRMIGAGDLMHVAFEHEETSGSTSATTFKLRIGPTSAGTVYVNGSTAARLFGGASHITLSVEEIA
jgi:hypothetical protein